MMQEWEYLQEEDLSSDDLNRYGHEGWELVGTSVTFKHEEGYGYTHYILYTFKRPIPISSVTVASVWSGPEAEARQIQEFMTNG